MKVKVVLPHSIGTKECATARPHQQLQLEGRKVAASMCCACCQMSGLANPKTVSKLPIADPYDMLSEKITLLMIVALDSKRNADGSHAVSSRFASGRSALPDVSLKRVTMCERVKQSSHVSIKPLFVGATGLLHTAHFHLTSMKTHSHANQCLVSGGSRDELFHPQAQWDWGLACARARGKTSLSLCSPQTQKQMFGGTKGPCGDMDT